MGTVVHLKNQINNSYFQLKDSVEEKLFLTEEKIKSKLFSDVQLVQKMTDYHIETGGKRLRALLTLGSAKLCGYSKGSRDVNLAACVELIHSATLMHDDVIDNGAVRRGKQTLNKVWNNHSSVLIGDYLLSRCFEMMVEDGNLEVLKLLSSASSKIAQMYSEKFDNISEPISQYIATPVTYDGDWTPDRVFMMWNMDVSNPAAYAKAFSAFSKKIKKKYSEVGSNGIGQPIVGQTDEYSHFVWAGFPDIATALGTTKKMYSDPMFAEYAQKVAGIRKLKSTYLMARLATFN